LSFQLIIKPEEIPDAVAELAQQPAIGFDTETTHLDPYRGRLRLVQLSTPDKVWLIDLYQFAEKKTGAALAPVRALLAAPRPVKIAHNAKFDAKWIWHHLGVELGGVFDTLLASQLIGAGDPDERHGLAPVVERFLRRTLDKTEQISDWDGPLTDSQLRYAAADAEVLPALRLAQIERLKAEGLVKVAQIEFECVVPLAALELNGFYLDAARWREQLEKVSAERLRLSDELQEMLAAGALQGSLFGRAEINLESQQQVSDALRGLGVPVPPSTRSWKLQPLAREYPAVAKLLEYRAVHKAATSFGETILNDVHPVTGRLHADFRQIGAPSGRMACSSPNIQQIPHDEAYRRCFRAPAGRKLIILDYSQIELRILGEMSGDEGFIAAFRAGADLHRATAAQVFGIAEDAVTSEQRGFAKALNFGIVYGIGAPRFAQSTGMSETDAENMMRRYFSTYRGLAQWLERAAARAVRERQARTQTGRLVRFRFDPADRQAVSGIHRMGKNIPVQGTASDIFKRALRLAHEALRGASASLVNVVHDEIVVECDEEEATETASRLEQAMCAAGAEFLRHVPVKVEAEIADEWLKS
jgi:DNA polymerase-1